MFQDSLESDASWIKKSKNIMERTSTAIASHYKKCNKHAFIFDCHILTIKKSKPSGDPNKEDIERAALAIYNKEAYVKDMYWYSKGQESPGKSFTYLPEYRYLKKTANFKMLYKCNGQFVSLLQLQASRL